MSERIVWLNGEFLPESEARISVRDRGFLLGDGCFETVSCYAGTLFRLNEHLDRLRVSLDVAGIRCSRAMDEIAAAAEMLPSRAGLSEARVRITMSRGTNCEVYPSEVSDATVLITAVHQPPVPKEAFETGWTATICKDLVHPGGATWVRAKSVSRLWLVMAAAEADREGADEAIMKGPDGGIVEGTRSNIFVVRADEVVTSPTASGALPGITRAEILQIAARLGLATAERRLPVEDLVSADECFLSKTTTGPVPITSVDGRAIGSGRPGDVTLRLADEYERVVRSACGPEARVRDL
jgi:branched-chain amino acid aminotransferase